MSARFSWVRLVALAVVAMGLGVAAFAGPANAADSTVWLCKPGDADDLCAGTIDGTVNPPPGQAGGPLGYTRPADPPIDCFYLYPTQSEQETPNSNLDKDDPIRRVAVQQARMFSSVCDVYAPMYRQVTSHGSQASHNDEVETAYQSALAGWKDYLANYNHGRGFILLGHSQGSAHTARLIDEEIDNNPELRSRMVGAFAPGGNVNVPIGELVGGMFQNVPACSVLGEVGCIVAFSTFKGYPGDTAQYSRVDSGYWIYDLPRADPETQEVMCVDPAHLDGSNGVLDPLINFDYLLGVPEGPETATPWQAQPDFYAVDCERDNGAHWLNLRTLDAPGDERQDLSSLVVSGNNYHVPEVNLTEGNLLRIAKAQSDTYVAAITEQERQKARQKQIADATAERTQVVANRTAISATLTATKAKYKTRVTQVTKLNKKLRAAKKKCRVAKRKHVRVKAKCKPQKQLTRKVATARRQAKSTKVRITAVQGQIAAIDKRIAELDQIIG